MVGPKLNDGAALLAGGSGRCPGDTVITKASGRYVRGSATKARAVLDLIRGLDVRRADEVLRFTDRGAAADVRKVLASAVANAVHNDSQDVDELFVVACYADEGPTLKRFRPRARGRASRINKRSCHITVVVARMSDERLEIVQARHAAGPGARRAGISAQARRERVARSRARAEGLREGEAAEVDDASRTADGEPRGSGDEVTESADEVPAASADRAGARDRDTKSRRSGEADAEDGGADGRRRRSRGRVDPRGLSDQGQHQLDEVPRTGYPLLRRHDRRAVLRHRRAREAAGYEAPAGGAKTARGQSEAETEPGDQEAD